MAFLPTSSSILIITSCSLVPFARTSSCPVLASSFHFFKPSSIFSCALIACFLASAITILMLFNCSTTRCISSLVACDLPRIPLSSSPARTSKHTSRHPVVPPDSLHSDPAEPPSSLLASAPTSLNLHSASSTLYPSCPCVFLHLASCS